MEQALELYSKDMEAMDAMERYKRQMMHQGFGWAEQQKLLSSTVLLAGVGGLGGELAYGLASAGVGKIIIVHSGELTVSNLNRQTLMSEHALGTSRAHAAAERLMAFSRFVDVEAYDAPCDLETMLPLAQTADLVIDARHNFPERKTLNLAAVTTRKPFLFAAMDGLESQMALFTPPTTGCLQCLYPDDPPDWDPFGFAVFGAVAHTIGAMAAMEAIKYLSGWGKPGGKLVTLDLATYRSSSFALRKIDNCPVCSGWK